MKYNVFLISAGVGRRLYPLTKDRPKCLVPFRDTTVLGDQLEVLRSHPAVGDIFIVTGYKADLVESYVANNFSDLSCRFIFNPFYEEFNNFVSVWLAFQSLAGTPCIGINGDDVFTFDCFDRLVTADESDVSMLISRKTHYDDDDMLIYSEGKYLGRVGKDLDPTKAFGESVGMIRYSALGSSRVFEMMSKLASDVSNLKRFYLVAIDAFCRANEVKLVEVEVSQWQEIDFHADVELIQGFLDGSRIKHS